MCGERKFKSSTLTKPKFSQIKTSILSTCLRPPRHRAHLQGSVTFVYCMARGVFITRSAQGSSAILGQYLVIDNPVSSLEHSTGVLSVLAILETCFGIGSAVPLTSVFEVFARTGSMTIVYCAWSFVPQKCSKTRRNARLFFVFICTLF